MRSALAVVAVLAASAPAIAGADDLPGNYDIKLEATGASCDPPPVTMKSSTLRVDIAKGALRVNIPTIPQMTGVVKGVAVDAKTPKVQPTTVQGLDAKYAIAGKLDNGILELVLEADYSAKGKPYCTQAWKVTGVKQAP